VPTPSSQADVIEAARELHVDLADDIWNRLAIHVAQLRKWQRAINLVGPSTLADAWHRHVLDSLQLLPLIPATARRLVDLGSGAGFPGLVIAVARPDLAVTLIEADARKAAFLAETARLIAPATHITATRIETLAAQPADVVTARALAPLSNLLAWASKFTSDPTICLFHKGERLDDELTAARVRWMMDIDRVPSVTAPGAAILRVARLRSRR
jgi:16S rRNA (guanine527-N7)-methyltransferase